MYKNGDPKKKVAKADATRVNIVRQDIPLPSSDNLFNYKESAAEMIGGLSGSAASGAVAGAKLGLVPGKYNKTITSIKRAKRK
jgi:hypothetical protein